MKRIFHEREAQMIYTMTTERQPVIYWATKCLLARHFFDSNTQKTTKRQVYPSEVVRLPLFHE